ARAEFPFFDLADGRRWALRPNAGRFPWWIFSRDRRVPGTRVADYLRSFALAGCGPEQTVAEVLGHLGPLYRGFWEPFAIAVLNTDPNEAAASLLWPVVQETFGRGETAYRPRIAREGLSESFVDPALAHLAARNVPVSLGRRLRKVEMSGNRIVNLDFGQDSVVVGANDSVVLAVPGPTCSSLVPDVSGPDSFRSILNVHFRIDCDVREPDLLGLLGGTAQWVFRGGPVASVTISAADDLLDRDQKELATMIWNDVARALGKDAKPIPPYRVIAEKRATFAQTPAQLRLRPQPRTTIDNLVLAGDWTDTGIPATIEGAIRSGQTAADLVIKMSVRS
ncbi:MAG: hydroxysqualene dehydroxylase HpnE, partial [Rhodospirillales bacterium]|nr:hydroxysqualene dehydroxylase HpnE [Rhodospirillales bacterium]